MKPYHSDQSFPLEGNFRQVTAEEFQHEIDKPGIVFVIEGFVEGYSDTPAGPDDGHETAWAYKQDGKIVFVESETIDINTLMSAPIDATDTETVGDLTINVDRQNPGMGFRFFVAA